MAMMNSASPFLWGSGGSVRTPEQVKREREIADALLKTDTSPIGHWTQGLARVLDSAIGAYGNYRASEDEKAGQDAYSPVGESFISSLAGESPVNSNQASVPAGADAATIRQGLISRGLPEHVADGFLMNFQDESGLNPGINEAAPTVPGSRGGYGLYQLTGPRRVAYEQYAAQKGVDPSNVDAQLDFMMSELQGPEANAAKSILAAPDAGSAAAAIATNFLRPAAENLAPRVAKYTAGGTPTQVASLDPSIGVPAPAAVNPIGQSSPNDQVAQALLAPQANSASAGNAMPAGQQIAQILSQQEPGAAPNTSQGGMSNMQIIAQVLSNPWAPPEHKQLAQALFGQQMQTQQQANDPLRQLQIQQAQQGLDAPIEVGGVLLDRNTMQPIFDSRTTKGSGLINAGDGKIYNPTTQEWITAPGSAEGNVPDSVKALDLRAQRAGLQPGTPEYNEFMVSGGRAGTSLSVGPDGTVNFSQGGSGKPLTEGQSKLTLFQSLQKETQPVLLDLESQFNPANLQDAAARSTPIAGNFFKSEQGQIYDSAATAWAEGALRIATGAAATPEEMERTKRAYFAQVGDTPNTIAFKAQMREMYNRAIDRSLGKPTEGSLPKPADFAHQVGGTTPPAAAQSQARIISQQEYQSLPSGSPFIAADDPTRTVRIKP